MHISPPDGGPPIEFRMLDDTGSVSPSLYLDDIQSLRIDLDHPLWAAAVEVETQTEPVWRDVIWLTADWRDHRGNSAQVGGPFWERFFMDLTRESTEQGRFRVSGMSMRARLFTFTSP